MSWRKLQKAKKDAYANGNRASGMESVTSVDYTITSIQNTPCLFASDVKKAMLDL